MSRFCMYCGRELEKDEKCNCAGSVAARQRKRGNADANKTEQAASGKTKKEKAKKARKQLRKPQFNKNERVHKVNRNGNFFADLWSIIKEFLKNPVYTVTNPGVMGKAESIVLVGIMGVVFSLVVYFSKSNVSRGMLGVVSRMIGFKGTQGFVEIANMLLNILTFTAFAYVQYFIMLGIFYVIQRYILRAYTDFWDIARRFAMTTIPISVIGLVGIVIGFFSMRTVVMLVLAAAVLSVVLVYEILKSLWQGLLEDRLVYIMSFGYFVYFLVCVNLFIALANA